MKYLKKHLILITILLVIPILLALLTIKIQLKQNEKDISKEEIIFKEEEPKEEIITKVSVDIKGAIKKPGVYEIEPEKKVIDVINLAGGLTDKANTSLINLAKKVQNEMVIIIYTNDEVEEAQKKQDSSIIKIIDKECICPKIKNDACINTETKKEGKNTTKEQTTNNTTDSLININTATKEELESITGIGASKAEAIISYREESGPFTTVEDIKNVPGIGESLYEKIKTYITV